MLISCRITNKFLGYIIKLMRNIAIKYGINTLVGIFYTKRTKRNYQLSGLPNPFASIQVYFMGMWYGFNSSFRFFGLQKFIVYFVKKLNDEYTVVPTTGVGIYLSNNKFLSL